MAASTRYSLSNALLSLLACAVAADEPPRIAADSPFAAAIEVAQQRTVKIFGAGIGRSAGYASGIVVGPGGQILTAQGIYLGADNLRVTLPDGQTHNATLVRRSNDLQAAFLKIDAATPQFFDLSQAPQAQPGDWVLAVSNAFKVAERDEPLSVNIGVLSLRMPLDARRGFQEFPYHADAFVYDAITSNPGADGGAVVTAEGKLLGMIGRVIESKSSGTRLNYAVPADLLARFVSGDSQPVVAASPTSPAATGKADLGIRLFALGGRRGPAYIDRVLPGGPAAAAGLKTDDLVVTIAGQVVRDASDFRRIVDSLQVGTEVVVEVKRKNDLVSVQIKPEAEK
jgi:S1-C subfamily serine protease